jgi:ABC-type transport system involved in multi-copper enzyme maturation permease subunit
VSWAVLRALVGVSWRERLLRPWFGVLLLVLCSTQVTMALSMEDLQDPVFLLVLLIGGGAIGKEVSSGVLPLLFTRPLVRGHYVLAKWFALASAIAIISTATLLVQAAFLAHRGIGLPGREVAAAVFTSVSAAFGITAVLLPLSVLTPGYTDVLVWIGLSVLPGLGRKYIPQRVAEEWRAFLHPSLDWGAIFGTASVGWFRLFSYLSTVALCLCLAVLAANRKELSYASG